VNEAEQRIADSLYAAMMNASQSTERAEQDKEFKVGISSLGHCSELVRRMIARIEPAGEQDWLAAILGTAMGEWIETHAVPQVWPDAITQSEVTVTLKGDTGTYNVLGHPDVVVLDNKGTSKMGVVRKVGPKAQQQFQRHLYGKAAWEAGMFPNHSLEEVRVGNVWHDRSAQEKNLHVQIEPFNPEVVDEATAWLDDVVYAYMAGEEARKEPHRAFCEGYCPHFSTCRAEDTDVEGLITDPETLAGVDLLLEAKALESEAKRKKNQAQIALKGVQGSTGTYTVRWVSVNGGPVSFNRESYMRLDVRKVR
jgi:hypothetical protein